MSGGGAPSPARLAVAGLGAPLLVALLYLALLGHRSDYVGHFLAGFGATLGAIGLATAARPSLRAEPARPWATLGLTLLCVGLGAVLEGSVFRIARFDPVDFCNQSLGAVFAGAAALLADAGGGPSRALRATGAVAAVAATVAGFVLAFR